MGTRLPTAAGTHARDAPSKAGPRSWPRTSAACSPAEWGEVADSGSIGSQAGAHGRLRAWDGEHVEVALSGALADRAMVPHQWTTQAPGIRLRQAW